MRVGFLADTHIGYSSPCRSTEAGVNTRVQDGYDGFHDTITNLIAAEVDAVLHGGDLFHVSHPEIADIVQVRHEFMRLHNAGIPIIGITGNHDFSTNRTKMSATAAVHAPELGFTIVDEPYQQIPLTDGVVVHAVSHVGVLARNDITPTPGAVNILLSHGVAAIPGHELFTCVDSPGEAILAYDTLTQDWDAVLLGHYHERGTLDGISRPGAPAMYAGSLLRRGFSDNEGSRGWTLLDITDTGITPTHHDIAQRAQYDLPEIDARGLTGSDLTEQILLNIASIDIHQAIVRQRILHATPAQRGGIDTHEIQSATREALQWRIVFPTTRTDAPDGASDWAPNLAAGLDSQYRSWLPTYATSQHLSKELTDTITQRGVQYLLHAVGESDV